jgi:hypothetical protein
MWRAQGDGLRSFLGDFVAAWPQIKFPAGLGVQLVVSPEGSWSSSRAPLLAPSPLRTGLEGFPFIRLEHPKTPP